MEPGSRAWEPTRETKSCREVRPKSQDTFVAHCEARRRGRGLGEVSAWDRQQGSDTGITIV